MSDQDIITPELAERVETLLDELRASTLDGQAFARLARARGIALVDPDRHRSLVDETVYQGVLHRSHHWRDLALGRDPVPMVLFCPRCGTRHVDQADPANGWLNEPHRSHLCAGCGLIWRPADIATVGVAAIATRGKLDDTTIEEPGWRDVLQKCARQFRLYERNHLDKAERANGTSDAYVDAVFKADTNKTMAEMCEALLAAPAATAKAA